MSAGETIEVRRDAAAGRFEIVVDDVVAGYADYGDADGVRTFPHTVVAEEFGGRGLAGTMVGEALRMTREEGLRVRPACSFVARYVEKNPDSADLA
ncbi:GNAT family N-acetyltransferase [Dietzia sp. UBA5065]|jgi:predicted GNAT family acetyltransferase|uniref:GNAT family N-acetyltransferase n=1 Tax=Dietzia sp. UBA5065 TaxID=1946422 RepID=UPI0025BC225C|nr:GNAT family N-acetyltransferase [Dietzia sp. UBA5065]HMT50764.1 GNAT family N-acetyltransferase [Dietzia sp.]